MTLTQPTQPMKFWQNEFGSFFLPHDQILDQAFLSGGGWELESIHFLLDRCFFEGVGTYIDAGAHVGLTTIPIARKQPRVRCYAFEPNGLNFNLLSKNIYDNKVADQVRHFNVALSDHLGYGTLELAPDNSVDHRLVEGAPQPGPWGEERRKRVPVECTTLAEALRGAPLSQPIVLKLDVQGAELAVLRGLGEIRPDVLLIEVWPYGLSRAGETLNNLIRELEKYGKGAPLISRYVLLRPLLHLELAQVLPWGDSTPGYIDLVCAK